MFGYILFWKAIQLPKFFLFWSFLELRYVHNFVWELILLPFQDEPGNPATQAAAQGTILEGSTPVLKTEREDQECEIHVNPAYVIHKQQYDPSAKREEHEYEDVFKFWYFSNTIIHMNP